LPKHGQADASVHPDASRYGSPAIAETVAAIPLKVKVATFNLPRSRRERKKIEMLFAHLKRILRLDRHRLRGHLALGELLLAATALNLRKLAKLILPAALKPA
jgi:hypothetical protein